MKWLPHAGHPRAAGCARSGPPRPDRLAELETLLGDLISARGPFVVGSASEGPLLIVVIDGGDRTAAKRLASSTGVAGCCVIELDGQPNPLDRTAMTLTVDPAGRLLADGEDGRRSGPVRGRRGRSARPRAGTDAHGRRRHAAR